MTRAKKGPKTVYLVVRSADGRADACHQQKRAEAQEIADVRDGDEPFHVDRYDRVDPTAAKDREIANRCRDWVEDMGECLFCDYGDMDDAHQVFCPLYPAAKKGNKR